MFLIDTDRPFQEFLIDRKKKERVERQKEIDALKPVDDYVAPVAEEKPKKKKGPEKDAKAKAAEKKKDAWFIQNQDVYEMDKNVEIDSDEKEFIEYLSWDTDSDEEDMTYDDEIIEKVNK